MLKYAWREILQRKNRSMAAVFSYALAVIIFSALISLLRNSDDSMYKTLQSTGTHFIAFKPMPCNCFLLKDQNKGEGFTANGTRTSVISTEIINEIKKFPSIGDASASLMFFFRDSISTLGFTIAGFTPENKISAANTTCAATDLIEGNFITSYDTSSVMIEHSYSISKNFHIGDSIKIANKIFRIKGIVNAGIRPIKADIYMPFHQAEEVISTRTWNPIQNLLNVILVESANARVHNQAMLDVKNLLGKDNVVSSYACHKPAASAINLNKKTLWFASILITLFIILHIFRNQYASIVERKREIGILHSIGWSGKTIMLFINYEFMLQTSIGGITGSLVTFLYNYIISLTQFADSVLFLSDSYQILITGFGLTFLTSMISAIMISYYTLSILPMKTLRTP